MSWCFLVRCQWWRREMNSMPVQLASSHWWWIKPLYWKSSLVWLMLSSFAAKRQRCPNAQNLCSLKNAQLKQLTPYRLSIVTDLPRGREGGGEGGREGGRELGREVGSAHSDLRETPPTVLLWYLIIASFLGSSSLPKWLTNHKSHMCEVIAPRGSPSVTRQTVIEFDSNSGNMKLYI